MKMCSILKWTSGILLICCLILFAGIFYLSSKDYSDQFQSRRGSLSEVIDRAESSHQKHWITLCNSDGFKVECGLLLPQATNKKFPAIILLGGKATGKYAIDYALDIDNVIILALDYPYEPRESYNFWTIVQDVPAVRNALFDMIPASFLALDYLNRRPDVDTTRIVMLGYSFGAPFVPVICATDRRISAAAMVYGGGDLRSLIRHNVGRYKGPLLSEFVGSLSGLLLRPLEPMRYADKISPTSLVMINGKNDEQIPYDNTIQFFNAAKEPKRLVWLDSQHVNVNNPELTRRIISTLKDELKNLNIIDKGEVN